MRHYPADSQVGQCWVLSAWVRQGRAQNICFQEIMEYFGGITWIHLEYLWRYLKNLLLKAQLISKPGLVAQGLVLSSMDIFPRMDVFPKDGDTLSSSTAPRPVWPRQPFVTWPGPAPGLCQGGVPVFVPGRGRAGAGAMVNMVLAPCEFRAGAGEVSKRGHGQGRWQRHSGWQRTLADVVLCLCLLCWLLLGTKPLGTFWVNWFQPPQPGVLHRW